MCFLLVTFAILLYFFKAHSPSEQVNIARVIYRIRALGVNLEKTGTRKLGVRAEKERKIVNKIPAVVKTE